MSKHLVWEPIFEDDVEKCGGIRKVRFLMYVDPISPAIDFILETGVTYADFLDATDTLVEKYGSEFSTMIDTGALSLAETIQCSTDGIQDAEEWRIHTEYLMTWKA